MESFSWKSHPARERPFAAILVSIIILAIVGVIYEFMDRSLFMAIIAAAVLITSLSTFYFPTTFTVDEQQVRIKYLFSAKERNLSAFRNYFPESRGILLSPYLSPSRLENFRGFYLRYGKGNKAAVDDFVKRLIDRQQANAARQGEVKPDAI